jgi:hypothetical protein
MRERERERERKSDETVIQSVGGPATLWREWKPLYGRTVGNKNSNA